MNLLQPFIHASHSVFADKKYIFGWIVLTALTLMLLITIPIKSIPGNSLDFQLKLYKMNDYLLLITISTLTALSLIMNFYALTQKKLKKSSALLVGTSGIGFISAATASIFSAATCTACIFSFFGFLSFGTSLFLLEYRNYLIVGSILILLISIYYTSLKILNHCESCRI